MSQPGSRRLASDQMRFPLVREPRARFAAFMRGPSNRAAAETLDQWPIPGESILALIGPEGAGKSHLAADWAERVGATGFQGDEVRLEDLSELEGRAILLDDADRTDDEILFHLMNLARLPGGALLLTSRGTLAGRDTRVPDLRSRLDSVRAVRMETPDETVLAAALRRFFDERAMTPADDLIDYLVLRMDRSIPAARAMVARLDVEAGGRKLNRALARELFEAETAELFQPQP
ncbi:chromosomal replication initiator DnaA [Brevundimonas aveniformis]|uniref:chromosomal replication initiator DnaA n=1 Tax=Brevundimonas aveniformis TaxID=370977 RepID=UPI00248FF394|nr:chromosomal replication initiator DnaA [Brevundimonas aveniformis]